jgi:ribosomal protein S10
MATITSLADEIRQKIAQEKPVKKKAAKIKLKPPVSGILQLIEAYDNTDHKNMVHVRFDQKTVQTLNHFKMATGVDVTKLVAFSVQELFQQHPELKELIKHFIQNVSL